MRAKVGIGARELRPILRRLRPPATERLKEMNERLQEGQVRSSRAVREYLEGLDGEGWPQNVRKSISTTDPAAEWTCAPGGAPNGGQSVVL
jgi:hypothetical protein